MTSLPIGGALLLSVLAGAAYTDQPAAKAPAVKAERPVVVVANPVERVVTDYQDFPGRTAAPAEVELRAHVSGYLVQAPFKEGAQVRQGDVLFEIDPRSYQAQLDQALSRVALDEASLKLAQAVAKREKDIEATTPGTISRQKLDENTAALEEAFARLRNSKAAVELCKLNLSFTKVVSPIDGRSGRRLLDPGNLVVADTTLLATIVGEDPMFVYFDIDERTLLRLRRTAIEDGSVAKTGWQAQMGLADETGFPRSGMMDFIDNRVDPDKGTIRMRAVFPNPKPRQGDRLLSPGMFARIRLAMSAPHKALLVTETALGSDQGVHYVYVVSGDDRVQYRGVRVGSLQSDGLRAIEEGLKPDDLVVVGRLQGLRPGLTVEPRKAEMPVGR